jgi:hypothetical protein
VPEGVYNRIKRADEKDFKLDKATSITGTCSTEAGTT